jgi:hypothetical protein
MPDRSKVMTQTKRMTWSSRLGVGSGAENPHPVKLGFVSKPHLKSRKVGWRKKVGGGHGPKMGRSAIEEEEKISFTSDSFVSDTPYTGGWMVLVTGLDVTAKVKTIFCTLAFKFQTKCNTIQATRN